MNKQEDIIIKKIADEIERREFRKEQEIADQKRRRNTLMREKIKNGLIISSELAAGFILLYVASLRIPGLSATRPEAIITAMLAGIGIMGGIVSFLLIREKNWIKKGN